MSKIAGIKGHSPEAYGDTGDKSGIQILSAVHNPTLVRSNSGFHQPPPGPGAHRGRGGGR